MKLMKKFCIVAFCLITKVILVCKNCVVKIDHFINKFKTMLADWK